MFFSFSFFSFFQLIANVSFFDPDQIRGGRGGGSDDAEARNLDWEEIVSIFDDIVAEGEDLSRRGGRSRSKSSGKGAMLNAPCLCVCGSDQCCYEKAHCLGV